MDDLSTVTAAPRTLRLAGTEYRIGKLSPRDVGILQAWLRDQVPNPRAEARKYMDGLPDAVAMHVWDEACEAAKSWPPGIESPAGRLLLFDAEGMAQVLYLTIRKDVAGFTIEQAREMADRISLEDYARLIALIGAGDPDDPKSPALVDGRMMAMNSMK